MKERVQYEEYASKPIITVEPEYPQKGEEVLRGGYPSKYRGKHRSHTHGAGALAFFRNRWMKFFNKG